MGKELNHVDLVAKLTYVRINLEDRKNKHADIPKFVSLKDEHNSDMFWKHLLDDASC